MFEKKTPQILFDEYEGNPLLIGMPLAEARQLYTENAVMAYRLEMQEKAIVKLEADNRLLKQQLDLAAMAAVKTAPETEHLDV